jgi:uncharacterized membrane protein (DUF4010 family)
MSDDSLVKIDHAAIKVNQGTIILLSILAFIIDAPWLILVAALFMLAGTIFKFPGFGFIYLHFLKPRGLVAADILLDNPEPHRFAQGLGAACLTFASIILLVWPNLPGMNVLGWGVVWLVIALAARNLFAGFCVGCMIYYWFNRLHLPGFDKSPPKGNLPGLRPKSRV